MEQKDFWRCLEDRVGAELNGLAGDDFRGWRCGTFIPQRLGLVGDQQAMIGTVWMAQSPLERWSWHFAILLRDVVQSIDQIDWAGLLPHDNVTGWLSLDLRKKEMKINLRAAHLDLKSD